MATSAWLCMRLLVVSALLGACAAHSPDLVMLRAAPADFTLDVTLHAPDASPDDQRRFIVEPDGSLRAGVGEGVGEDYYPPLTRTLTRDQMNRLWRLVRDSGLLDPDAISTIDPGPMSPGWTRPWARIDILYAGRRGHYAVLLDAGTPDAHAARRIADHLSELAWLEDQRWGD